jgi:hypothetical protein
MNQLNTFIARWKAPTEKWFKGLLKVGLFLTGIGTALVTAPSLINGFVLPPPIDKISQWLCVAGVVMSFVSKTSSTEHNN